MAKPNPTSEKIPRIAPTAPSAVVWLDVSELPGSTELDPSLRSAQSSKALL